MLYPMKDLLDHALENHYCVMAPSIRDVSCMRAAIEAAEELRSPIILNCYFPTWDYDWDKGEDDKIRFDVAIAREYAIRATVPVAINRDHTYTYEGCMQAIAAGVTSVMMDCSTKSFEENVAGVAAVVQAAHAVGVSVEAELGHVGVADAKEMAAMNMPGHGEDASHLEKDQSVFTDPELLAEFVKRTGADCVAVSIGNAHGPYAKGVVPHIEHELLAELRKAVPNTPLVLHGGSGTADEDLTKAAQNGICKINVGTEVEKGAWQAVVKVYEEKGRVGNPFKVAREGYKAEVKRQMELLCSVGKAW